MPTATRRREDALKAKIAPLGWTMHSRFGWVGPEAKRYQITDADGVPILGYMDGVELTEAEAFAYEWARSAPEDYQPGMIVL